MKASAIFALGRVILAAGKETPAIKAALALEPTLEPVIDGRQTLAQAIDAFPTDAGPVNGQRDAACALAYVSAEIMVDPNHAPAFKAALKACLSS